MEKIFVHLCLPQIARNHHTNISITTTAAANYKQSAIRGGSCIFRTAIEPWPENRAAPEAFPTSIHRQKTGLELYDLKNDVSESQDVAADHPDIVKRLQAAAEIARADLGDKLKNRKGNGVRPNGRLSDSDARLE